MSVRKLARATGLSPSAVSLALRNSAKIPESTRRRVQAEAERLGYRPSGKVAALMSQVRLSGRAEGQGCFGVISLYDQPRPWQGSEHLTRIYRSMERRAGELGYRLDSLWLREPGMSVRRFRGILAARGIEGLLCFGAPNVEATFPESLNGQATVTLGLSIATPLHRVMSHFAHDVGQALTRVWQLGYRRPGLLLGHWEEARSAQAYTGAYLAWCERELGVAAPVPILRMEGLDSAAMGDWLRTQRPDVVIVVHRYDVVARLGDALKALGLRVPREVGVVVVSQRVEGTGFAGVQQNQALMGAWAVELLVARVQHRDFGVPTHPRVELVESEWVDGPSLRRRT